MRHSGVIPKPLLNPLQVCFIEFCFDTFLGSAQSLCQPFISLGLQICYPKAEVLKTVKTA